ncbi:hypothetical protein GCM10017687_21190 [Streptomyces echinatus]
MRPYVTGAGVPRTVLSVLPAAVLQVLIMTTEHDVTGRKLTDRLAAVDGRAASPRQAVGLRPTRVG